MRSERGSSLIETTAALALLCLIGAAFLGGLTTASKSRLISDEQASARILAESQMEHVKKQAYSFSYEPAPIPDAYPGYTALIEADPLRNGNIQRITITIRHQNKEVTMLEGYKVNR
jgi:type II secretory pathway pseudopilin PulG